MQKNQCIFVISEKCEHGKNKDEVINTKAKLGDNDDATTTQTQVCDNNDDTKVASMRT